MDGNVVMLRNRNHLLCVQCRCGHRTVFAPADLVQISQTAEMASLARLLRSMRCCLCGAKGADGVAIDGLDRATAWQAEAER